MKLYLAGPMRGIPEFNFPAFHKATGWLREQGHEVFSPAEHDLVVGLPLGESAAWYNGGRNIREALAADVTYICLEADGIALLPGWENSKGAVAERALAIALGLEVTEL